MALRRYNAMKRARPSQISSGGPTTNNANMLNRMWVMPLCRNADVNSRYTSPFATAGDHMTNSASTRDDAVWTTKAMTLTAISTYVTTGVVEPTVRVFG